MQNDFVAPHAGCVGAPDAAAGCEHAPGDRPAGAESPQAADDGAGCTSTAAAVSEATTAKPPATVREFERALRTLGFTRSQASDIARQGFIKAAGTEVLQVDPMADQVNELRALLARNAAILKGST